MAGKTSVEAQLRESVRNAAFRTALTDALRLLEDPGAMEAAAVRLLGEHLGASRVLYAEVNADSRRFFVAHDYTAGVPTMVGEHQLEGFGGAVIAELRAGRSLLVPDVQADTRLSRVEHANYASVAVAAHIGVPLIKGGRFAAIVAVHQATPRAWTPTELALVEETAERIWAAVERARAEAALRVSEARFRAVQETSIDGFMVLESLRDESGAIVDFVWRYANDAAERIVGRPRDSFLNRRLLDIMPGNRVEGLFDAYVRVVETGEPWTHEAIYRHEGLDIYIRLVAAKANDGFAVSFADLSERRRAEERMRESEERFRTLADSMPQLIWTARADGSVDYLSQQWAAYIGLSPEQLYNWGWEQVVHPDDLPGTRRVWGQSIQTGTPVEVRHRFRHVSGAWRWQLVRGIPLYDAVGQVRRWVGTCTDVHESETREQDARFLADISERIRVADDTEPLLLLIAQELGRYLEVQRCFFAEIFEAEDRWVVHHDYHEGVPSIMGTYPLSAYNLGTRQEVAAGRTIIVTDAETDPRCSAAYEQAYRPLAVNAHVVVPLLREGAWVSTLIVTCDGPRGWQDREVALLESVTERTWNTLEKLRAIEALQASEARLQELYAQEQAARAQAEEASRLKDEFLATVSHELRTPLTALIGYLGLLQTRRYDEAYLTRTLEKLMRSAQAQAELIDDLLDVSRIVNGRLGIDPQPIEFIPVIRGALDTVRPALEARGLALRVELDPTASRIVGDPNRLQQVVWNLLSNAVKFTPTGGLISVSLAVHEGAALLTVRDTGQGIRADFLPFVFERFRQADGTSTRSYNGLGLGLALVRHLVELHGGSVAATSAGEGQGATFTVRLPLETVPALPEPGVTHARPSVASSPTPLRGLRVLVVDDQPDLLELLDETLTLAGATVIRCDEAVGALDELQRVRPDLLITDLAMPDRDGYWLIEQVRALPAEHGGLTPAIALTAYARIGERRRLLTAGFQEYVPKPVNPAELLAIVERLARAEP